MREGNIPTPPDDLHAAREASWNQHAVVHEKLDDVRDTILARLHDYVEAHERAMRLRTAEVHALIDDAIEAIGDLRADFEASLTRAQKAKITKARKE